MTVLALVGVDATSKQQEAIRKGDRDWLCFPAALCYGISDDLGGSRDHSTAESRLKIEKNVLINPAWIDAVYS